MSGILWSVLAGSLLAAEPATALPAAGSKAVLYGGQAWTVADSLAYPCQDGNTCAAFAPKPFDRERFFADGVIDSEDIWEHTEPGALFLLLEVDADGNLVDLAANLPEGSTHQSDESMRQALSIVDSAPGRLVGNLDYRGEGESIRIEFDLEILAPRRR